MMGANDETAASDEETEEVDEVWEKSKSKSILRMGIISGSITSNMKPKQVWLMDAEHKQYTDQKGKNGYSNWSNNLRNLREAIRRDRGRMGDDCIAYGHDLAIVKSFRRADEPIPWHRSDAYQQLKDDIKNGIDQEFESPLDFYFSRIEYHQAHSLEVFRKHLYQERDSAPKRAMRFERKKKAWKFPELHKDHPRMQQNNEDGCS